MRVIWLVILLVGALVANCAEAASFDCKKAVSATEKMICKDGSLSSLDEKLQQSYQAALRAVDPISRPRLVAEQRNWITYVRNICQGGDCLAKAYEDRIAMLDSSKGVLVDVRKCSIPDGDSCRSVVYYRDSSYRMASFNKTLVSNKRSERVIGCDRLIDLPVGFANSNHSFGGYCTVIDGPVRSKVLICDDDMVGHFAMQPLENGVERDEDLIGFTKKNCFGG